jgi:uncharacterized membrane protein YidH (DUF202 family)
MDPQPSELMDVGAQAERTALAWQRTGIGTMAAGGLAVRWSVTEQFPLWPGVLLVLFGAFASLVLVRRRYRRVVKTVRAGQSPRSRILVPGAALLMMVVVLSIGAGIVAELLSL